MNEKPLDELIADIVEDAQAHGNTRLGEDALIEYVLNDSRIQLLKKGYDAHDRSGDLEDVFLRDVRRKVARYSETRNGQAAGS